MMLVMLALTLFGMGTELVLAERNLTDKTVLITGAARGIGYCMADHFLQNGVKLMIIVDKNDTSGPAAAETLSCKYGGDKVVFINGDVRTDLDEVYQTVLENYGCVDVLVNDAGVENETDVRGMLYTNTIALMMWSLKFRDLMRTDQSSECANGGVILNIGSVAGHLEFPFMPSLIASKSAVEGFTRSLGHLYNERNTSVAVIGICPGPTYTAMTENMVVEDFQEEDFKKIYSNMTWQEPDAVGSGAVEIFKNAESGTIWDIVGGEAPYLSSSLIEYTLKDIDEITS